MQLVLDADQGRYPTLGRLNRWLEELATAGKDAPDEAPPPAEGGAIRVMTIHASKGLEAPAVFLVNAAPTPNVRSDGWLVEWPSGDARPRHFLLAGRADVRDGLSRELADRQKARDEREALNLLYVAVTRARQYLFVSAFESRRGDPAASWHGVCRVAVERLSDGGSAALPGALPDAVAYRSGIFPQAPEATRESTESAIEDAGLRGPFIASARMSAPSHDDEGLRDADSAARGIAIHWLLQQLADGRSLSDASLPTRLAAVLGTAPELADCRSWVAEAERVIAAPALRRFFDAATIQRSWNEVSVQALVDGQLRGGIIDRLVDDGSRLWILDYKTAPRPQPDEMAMRYRGQLAAYADGISALWPGRSVSAGLVLTATTTWIDILQR
jgi:ATP-dependent helicase/nuclease subunit A